MCFSKNASLSMFITGMVFALYFYRMKMPLFALTVVYYSIMQLIHYVGYLYIDQCDNKINQLMAKLNFIHIAFQPFVTLLGSYDVFRRYNIITPKQLIQFKGILWIALLTSFFQFSRIFKLNMDFSSPENCVYCGEKPCSSSGHKHIAFHLPLRNKPGYITPTLFTHFTYMFLPFLLFNNTTRMIGILTFMFGMSPAFIWKGISGSEAGSIWCFGSIAHCLIIFAITLMKKKV